MSPSGISDRCGTVSGMVTPKERMSKEGDTLHVSVLPYRCSICPPLVSVLVVAQPSSEVPEGLMNYPVYSISLYLKTDINCNCMFRPINNLYQFIF